MTSQFRSHVKISSQSALSGRSEKQFSPGPLSPSADLSKVNQEKEKKIHGTRSTKRKLIKERLFLLIIRKYFAKFYANKFESFDE